MDNKAFSIKGFGLINYFKFKNEEFRVDNGVVVLQGTNGTGKSLLMGSIMPNLLIMDLKRSVNLGERRGKDVSSFVGSSEAPSYIWAEIGNDDKIYTLVGIYKTNTNKVLDQKIVISNEGVFFKDLTFKDHNDTLLNAKKFRNVNAPLIENIYDNRKEYKKQINDLFFKFPDPDGNLELFDMNINNIFAVESIKAKNSNESKPQRLKLMKEDLKKVLPDLDEDAENKIRGFIDSVKSKKELEDRDKEFKRLGGYLYEIDKYTKLYNRNSLEEIFNISKVMDKNKIKFESDIRKLNKNIDRSNKKIGEYTKRLEAINARRSEIKTRLDMLKIDDINLLFEKRENLKDKINNAKDNKSDIEDMIKSLEISLNDKNKDLNRLNDDIDEIKNFLEDEGYFYSLVKENNNIDQMLNKQIDLLKQKNKLIKDNQENIIKKDLTQNTIKNINESLKEKQSRLEEDLNQFYIEYREYFKSLLPNAYDNYIKHHDMSIDTITEADLLLDQYFEDEMDSYKANIDSVNRNINELQASRIDEVNQYEKLVNTDDSYVSPYEYREGIELFKLIDFKDTVYDDDRRIIESSLADMGLLFAIFDSADISYGLKSTVNDYEISGIGLNKYFDIDNGVDGKVYNQVKSFLAKIFYEDKKIKTDIVEYHYKDVDNIGFVGEAARKEKRERLILKKKELIEKIDDDLDKLRMSLAAYEKELNDIRDIADRRPKMGFYDNAMVEIKSLNKDLASQEDDLKFINETMSLFNSRLGEIKSLFYDEFERDDILKLNNEKILISRIKDEIKDLNSLEIRCKDISFDIDKLDKIIDENKDKINVIDAKIDEDVVALKVCEDDLQKRGADEAIDESYRLRAEEKDLEDEKEEVVSSRAVLSRDVEEFNDELVERKNDLVKINDSLVLRDELLSSYKIYNLYNDWDKDLSDLYKASKIPYYREKINEYRSLFNNEEYKNYYASVNNFLVDNIDITDINIKSIVKEINNINLIKFKRDKADFDYDYVYNEILSQIKYSDQMTDDDNLDVHLREFQARSINKVIADTTNKGLRFAKSISESMDEKKQIHNTSFFITYKLSDRIPAFKRNFFKGTGNEFDSNYKKGFDKFMKEIVDLIYDCYNENYTDDEVYDSVFELLNYKEFIDVVITIDRGDGEEKSLDKEIGALSNGELARAVMEPLFIVLRSNLKNSLLGDKALSMLLLDEGFGEIDVIQQRRLEDEIYRSFSTMIIAEHNRSLKGPSEGNRIINYYTLKKSRNFKGGLLTYSNKISSGGGKGSSGSALVYFKNKEAKEIYVRS